MSIDAMDWAWKQKNLKPREKFLLIVIANYCDANHEAFLTAGTLQEKTLLSNKKVIKALSSLIEKQLIVDIGPTCSLGFKLKVGPV